MRVDRLTSEDWQRLREIRLQALKDTPDAFGRTLEEEAAFEQSDWQRRLTSESANFIAVIDGIDSGLVGGAKWRGRDGVAGLFSMWVAPHARSRGVGAALVGSVIDWARHSGFERLVLDVADDNHSAIRLYARTGFEPTGATGTLPSPREHVTEHERALLL